MLCNINIRSLSKDCKHVILSFCYRVIVIINIIIYTYNKKNII